MLNQSTGLRNFSQKMAGTQVSVNNLANKSDEGADEIQVNTRNRNHKDR